MNKATCFCKNWNEVAHWKDPLEVLMLSNGQHREDLVEVVVLGATRPKLGKQANRQCHDTSQMPATPINSDILVLNISTCAVTEGTRGWRQVPCAIRGHAILWWETKTRKERNRPVQRWTCCESLATVKLWSSALVHRSFLCFLVDPSYQDNDTEKTGNHNEGV